MDPAVLRAVETTAERLQHAGYRERDLGPGWPDGARAFRRADFRVQWVFTRLHTNVLLVPLDDVGGDDVDRMTDAAVGWATRTKDGLPVGLQNGVAAMCVLVCGTPSDEAVRRAEQPPRKRWSAIGLPVVVDAAAGSYGLYRGQMSWGAFYQSFLAQQQRVVLGQHDAAVLGSAGSRVGRRLVIGSTVLGALLVVAAIAVLLLL